MQCGNLFSNFSIFFKVSKIMRIALVFVLLGEKSLTTERRNSILSEESHGATKKTVPP